MISPLATTPDRDDLFAEYADTYEDAFYGFNPNAEQMNTLRYMTDDEIRKAIEWLRQQIRATAAQEAEELAAHCAWLDEQEAEAAEAQADDEWMMKWGQYYD